MIVVQPTSVQEEELGELGWAHYPQLYGPYISFSETRDSQHYLCGCAHISLENYFKLQHGSQFVDGDFGEHNFYNQVSKAFHPAVFDRLQKIPMGSSRFVDALSFKNNICHKCLGKTPSLKYCHPMYGGKFKQQHGWYIMQQAYEWGIDYTWMSYEEAVVPNELMEEFDFFKSPQGTAIFELKQAHGEEAEDFQSELRKQNRRVRNLIENSVRQRFGVKNIGEGWYSESMLYRMIKELYPESNVIHHYRPDFLGRQELDVYIDKYGIGVEYQGEQHFKPIAFWGGEEALRRTQERDKRKKGLCDEASVPLVYFNYNEDITPTLVKRRIDEVIMRIQNEQL